MTHSHDGSPKDADGTQRRAHERFDIRLPVTVLHVPPGDEHGEPTAYTGETRNVSLGGMLISGDAVAVPFGASVRVRIELPALKVDTEIPATVRWIRDGAIGIQFGSLRANQQWALNQLTKGAPNSVP